MSLAVRRFNPERLYSPQGVEPLALQSLLPHDAIDIEIGAGVGFHAIRYATENPDRVLVAIERTTEKFKKFKNRLSHHPPLPNLIAVQADVQNWVAHCLGHERISRCFVFYPNPEFKAPNRRWLRAPFFGYLREQLQTGAQIFLATNEPQYACEAKKYAKDYWCFWLERSRELEKKDLGTGGIPRTHFEKKYLQRGETCFDLVFRNLHTEKWKPQIDGPFSERALKEKMQRRGFTVTQYSYPPGCQFEKHMHAFDKLDGVISGQLEIKIQGHAILLERGDLVFVPSGVIHEARVVGLEPVVSLDGAFDEGSHG